MNKGAGNADAFIILAVLIVITLVSANRARTNPSTTGGILNLPTNNSSLPNTTNTSVTPSNTQTYITPSTTSAYSKNVYIGTGNATYAQQSYEEYITLNNSGNQPIDITGWQLKNGKGNRAYDISGGVRYFPSDIATIPQGARFISPFGSSGLQDIVLEPGETAIITTGTSGSQYPYKISSFKENICSSYIENLDEYNFTPSLSYSCPRPADEPGVSGLSTECRQFIERMPSCQTPKFDTRDAQGDTCQSCVNGKSLPNSCVAFIKSHFSYNGCIANHLSDTNFSLKTWRVYLGKGWEMWAEHYETIELFDQLGRLVNKYSY